MEESKSWKPAARGGKGNFQREAVEYMTPQPPLFDSYRSRLKYTIGQVTPFWGLIVAWRVTKGKLASFLVY